MDEDEAFFLLGTLKRGAAVKVETQAEANRLMLLAELSRFHADRTYRPSEGQYLVYPMGQSRVKSLTGHPKLN